MRSTKIGDLNIKRRQAIGFIDGELTSVGDSPYEVLWEILPSLDMEESEVISIYYGENTKRSEAEEIADRIRQQYPHLEVELVYGGQPHYNYIASVE